MITFDANTSTWIRHCPQCGKELRYPNCSYWQKFHVRKAERKGTVCKGCHNKNTLTGPRQQEILKGTIKQNEQGQWVRQCPQCGQDVPQKNAKDCVKCYRQRRICRKCECQRRRNTPGWWKRSEADTEREKRHQYYLNHREEIIAKSKARYYATRPQREMTALDLTTLSPEERWYHTIRLNILKGISTNTLPQAEQDKWWNMLKERVHKSATNVYTNEALAGNIFN